MQHKPWVWEISCLDIAELMDFDYIFWSSLLTGMSMDAIYKNFAYYFPISFCNYMPQTIKCLVFGIIMYDRCWCRRHMHMTYTMLISQMTRIIGSIRLKYHRLLKIRLVASMLLTEAVFQNQSDYDKIYIYLAVQPNIDPLRPHKMI